MATLKLKGDAAIAAAMQIAVHAPELAAGRIFRPPEVPSATTIDPDVAATDQSARAARIAQADRLHARYLVRNDICDTLAEYFGATVFDKDEPVPLQIGVHAEIIELLDGVFEPQAIRDFMKWWTARHPYLAAVARGDSRRGLDGEIAGEVEYGHRIAAHNGSFRPNRYAARGDTPAAPDGAP